MSATGGYFGLELTQGKEYHADAIKLNTGRNALEYILLAKQYKKIYLPYYTCDVLLQPIKKLDIVAEFYNINKDFEPLFDFSTLKKNEVFLYTNYFGLKERYITKLSKKVKNLIVDNAQAFFAKPINGADTLYSPRKFFGVSDGGYVYCSKKIKTKLKQDVSHQRFQHLLVRLDESAEEGYPIFSKNDASLDINLLMQMSNLTQQMLKSIDYKSIAKQRLQNYLYLKNALDSINTLKFTVNKQTVPLVYPFYSTNTELRKKLINHHIYTAQYWQSVLNTVTKNSIEYDYTKHIIHLPIDQRLNKQQLDTIIKIIKHEH